MVVAAAAVAALLWANISPDSYTSVWETRLAIVLGGHELATDLRGWVNEGLMTLFFLVVGLEAKRELDLGELRERSRLAIPVVAALGGMAGAAGVYLAINAGGDGAVGWGAALSTDTALALGALALVTRPIASPAITASTPDSNIASQIPNPTSTAAGPRHGPAKRSAMSTPNSPIATASAVTETRSE